ncbi:bidirectional sugar transporter SWEET16-like [Rhododendron vialii]|uniref:bidirectional sugar transporter SWEET16-like n=1 Tax=Rhododendron vialii TaxID=182163 RepID=UPI00265FF2B9|nr:bidirectional sugar transporter SWEET16-like [Rhododendron vialii]
MSFSLSFFLLLNAGCWFTFALILKDIYVIVPNAIGIATSSSQILLYMIYKNKSPLSNSIGSIQATDQEAIEMRSTNVAKTENPSLSKGNHNPKSSSHPTSLPLMRTLLQSPHETHHDFPTEQDEEDRISVVVDHP